MQRASESVPSGMLSVIGRSRSDYVAACLEACDYCKSMGIENPVCEVSNYLFPDGQVIAGHLQVLLQNNDFRNGRVFIGIADTNLYEGSNISVASLILIVV